MIHLALLIVALYVVWRAGLWAIAFVADAFDQNFVFGCLSLIVIMVGAVILLAVAC